MNVTLCSVRTDLDIERTCPPLGVLTLAAVITEATAHRVQRVVLPLEYPEFLTNLERELRDCDVIGVSTTSYNWHVARRLVERARQVKPEITIVLGGVHPSFFPEYCLQSTAADIVVRNEGEKTLPELLDALARGLPLAQVRGITFKDSDGSIRSSPDRPVLTEDELTRAPLPAYHWIPPGQYGYAPFEGSRGCRYNCAFCSILFPRSHRAISPFRAAALIQLLRKLPDRFPGHGLFFTDDAFGTRGETTREILQMFSRTGFVLGVEGRYNDLLRHDLLSAMDQNSFYLIQVGVEAGYQEGIDRVDKRLQVQDIYDFARTVGRRSFRRAVTYSMTLGLPWESEEQVLRNINFGCELAIRSNSQAPLLNNFNPLPGSNIVKRPGEYAMRALEPSLYDNGGWFRTFLGFTTIPPANREYLQGYRDMRLRMHPALPVAPTLGMPDGKLVANPVWDVGLAPLQTRQADMQPRAVPLVT